MRSLSAALPFAIALCVAAPAFADAQSHVQAARRAERRGEWHRALEAWKAAYAADVNAEYLIGIGDAYVHLGNPDEAKKNYDAYLADPLALPANVEKVKTKLAALDNPGGGLALPGTSAALLQLPGLVLPAAPVAEGRKGKRNKGGEPPPLPALDLPGTQPALVASNDKNANSPGLSLPGLDLPGTGPAAQAKKEPDKKVASREAPLQLPGISSMAAAPATARPGTKEQPAVAVAQPLHPSRTLSSGAQVAVASPPHEKRPVPEAVVAQRPPSRQPEASGSGKTLAYVAAGVAVVGLGGGAFFFTQAGSAHSDLTSKPHDSATAQSLLDKEKSNKTLSFVGFASGLAAAGVAAALFAF